MSIRFLVALTGLLVVTSALASPKTAQEPIAASVDGQPITIAELDAKAAADLAREDENYKETLRRAERSHRATTQALREATLDGLIREKTLAAEAKATGQRPEDILAAHAAHEPTDEEMRAYYKANATPSAPPYEQVTDVIRTRLAAENRQKAETDLARTLRGHHAVEWHLPRERLEVAADGPSRGPADAPVALIEFADFQCPYCSRLEPLLKTVLERYPTQVKLVYRQLPIPQLHPEAERAAQLSLCAAEQDRFWPMHDALFTLFADRGTLDAVTLNALSETIGLKAESVQACLESGRTRSIIERDVKAADALGVEGTPSLFLNGRPLRGGVSEESLRDAIDEELALRAREHG